MTGRTSVSDESEGIPAELAMPTPRRVALTGTGWLNVFAAMFFFFIGVGLGFHLVHRVMLDRAKHEALQKDGIRISSQVTRKWTQGRSSVPHISYTFAVNGVYYTGQSQIPKELWRSLRADDSLPVMYLPENPSINRPTAWEVPGYSNMFLYLYPAFIVVFGLFIVRRLPLQRRLAAEGIGVRGCVTECVGPSRSGFSLDYSFRNANSHEVEIGSCPSDRSWKVGSNVWVIYLPSDPSRSEIYPFNVGLFRIEQ